MIVQSHYTLL